MRFDFIFNFQFRLLSFAFFGGSFSFPFLSLLCFSFSIVSRISHFLNRLRARGSRFEFRFFRFLTIINDDDPAGKNKERYPSRELAHGSSA